MALLAEIWKRKRYWLMPLIVFAALLTALLFLNSGDVVRIHLYKRS